MMDFMTKEPAANTPSDDYRRSIVEAAKARRKFDIWFAAAAICASIVIMAVGLLNRVDLYALLGDWRPGALVLFGAIFLFAYTVQIHLRLRHESRLADLEQLYSANAHLAEIVTRKLRDHKVSAAE
jgi:hypothetical protein